MPTVLTSRWPRCKAAGAAAVHTREFDADDLASHGPLVASIIDDYGPIGTAVLAFGILGDQARAEVDAAHAVAVVHTDYVAQVSMLTHLATAMRSAGRGSLVVFSSVAGVRVRRANYVYGSAKAGLDGFASGLADALHGTGVRLLIVRPGFVIGRMTEGMTPAPLSSTPEQVAAATARALAKGRRTVWIPRAIAVVDCRAAIASVRLAQDAAMIIVVGIGADGMPGLSEASRRELHRATVIYGSKRQLDLLDDTVLAPRRQWPSPMLPALRGLLDEHGGEDVHVVASGDPLMHGIGGTLIRLYRARPGHRAAARLGGDAGVCADGVERPRHRGDQPGHRAAGHRGTPRRPGDRAVQRPVHTEGARGPAQRVRPRRFRIQRARTARRPRGASPRRHRAGVGRRYAR